MSLTHVETLIGQLSSELEQGRATLSNQDREAIEGKLSVLNDQLTAKQQRLKNQDIDITQEPKV